MERILGLVSRCLYAIAIFSASTPSQMGAYQPECPEILRKKIHN